jgi:hypothetical protein
MNQVAQELISVLAFGVHHGFCLPLRFSPCSLTPLRFDSVSSCRNSASGIWFREPSLVSIAPGSEVFSVSALVLACMETVR